MDELKDKNNFSIVITTYNRCNLLKKAVDSAFNQTVPCEVVVVDDESSDGTEEYCKGLGRRIVYLRNEKNKGHSFSVNRGVGAATGSWIKFLDDDDYLDSRCIEYCSEAIKRAPGSVICSVKATITDKNGRYIRFTPQVGEGSLIKVEEEEAHYGMLYDILPFGMASQVAVQAEAFLKSGGWNPDLKLADACDEIECFLKVAKYGSVLFLNIPLVYHVLWEGNYNDQISYRRKLERNIIVKEQIYSLISEKHKTAAPSFSAFAYYLSLWWAFLALRGKRFKEALGIITSTSFSHKGLILLLNKIFFKELSHKIEYRRVFFKWSKILLIGNYLPDKQKSMMRVAKVFKDSLGKRCLGLRVSRPAPFLVKSEGSTRGLNKFLGYIDKFLVYPRSLQKETRNTDLVHICDHSNSIYVKHLNKPNVVTCCDLLAVRSAMGDFKENRTRLTGRILQGLIIKGLEKSSQIVCISEATKKDLIRISNYDDKNAKVAYLPLNYNFQRLSTESAKKILGKYKFDFNKSFLLHVGKNNWYKNRAGLIDIFNLIEKNNDFLGLNLICAGDTFPKNIRKRIDKYGISGRVFNLVEPENEEICALYSLADALVYPSIAEGFGWPIVEAQACGCPVFASGRAPMTEAGGDAAVYFDPDNTEEATKIIVDAMKDEKKIQEMKQRGLENVKRFDDDKMVNEYIRVYREAIESYQQELPG